MKFEIDLVHIGSGPFFFASGKRKPDAYRFERVKGKEHIHRLTVPGEQADDILSDLGLRLQQLDIPVLIRVIIEPNDLDGADALAKTVAERDQLKRDVEELEASLNKAKERPPAPVAVPTVKAGPSKEQEAMLLERDGMIALLAKFAQGSDTPLDVLKRLVAPPTKKKPGK